MNAKLYPWIPVVGLVLVPLNSEKDMGLANPIIFFASAIWQVATILPILLGVIL